jgi:hypothetical protein
LISLLLTEIQVINSRDSQSSLIMSIIQSAGSFIPDLKTDPNIHFSKWREVLFQEAMNTENAILGQYGLLFIFLSNDEWEALPHNLLQVAVPAVPAVGGAAAVAAIPAVYRERYDFQTPVPRPPNNAANAVLKDVEMQTNNKATVYKAYLLMRAKMINSFSQADITALSEYPYGVVGNRSAGDLYNHAVVQYNTLSQADFNTISAQLGTPKTATQTYADLASAHRDLHAILLNAGQPISEKDKCAALIEALNKDAAGMYAAQLYAQSYPQMHTRTFNGLVTHINLHARNAILTTGTMHYASAAIVAPVPALGAADTAALQSEIAQLKKELNALKKSNNNARTKHYCWVHGTCFHAGTKCTVMLADKAKYTSAHLNSTSSNSPPGGKA